MTVVLDPRWPKERLARVGRDVSFAWLALNRLPLPDRIFLDRESANAARREADPRSKDMLRAEWCGVYQRPWAGGWSGIALNLPQCITLRRVRPRHEEPFWNAPAGFNDYTPFGVMCHEVGHHVDYILHPQAYSRQNGFQEIVDNEEEVSRAETNVLESFAEAIRLFITNPHLLEQGRPDRYEYLTKCIGLKPLHQTTWRRVLSKAGPRVVSATESWLRL